MRAILFATIYLSALSFIDFTNDTRIVIIGAGAAGIAAASRLYKNGFTNIKILEASNRIGGRIHSVQLGEHFIDLGAEWCHGENLVYEMVKNLQMLTDDASSSLVYHSRLKRMDVLKDLAWESKEELALVEECLDLLQRHVETVFAVFSWLKLAHKSDLKPTEGNNYLGWNGLGYKTILEILMGDAPVQDSIFLNKRVGRIYLTPRKARVKCTDGSSHIADHVIWTPSLGVLKRHYSTLFRPKLSKRKIRSIQSLGYDAIAKIFLHFPHKWWNADFGGAEFVWNKEDLQNSAHEFPEGPKLGNLSWTTRILSIFPNQKNPNVLSAWYSGELVPEIEKLTDDTIIDGLMHILPQFLADEYPNITRPDRILRKSWYADPHFYGTYSFESVESQKLGESQAAVLSEPIVTKTGKSILLFAGEATSQFYFSTVHGAIETGFREADRIINLYK
ncbi:hypothetical protein PPYR_12242 [Photinus pyralis]|uniref:Amine oxidase domain-containing protein n=1 Tax=Photinus pyralis TaxID=7054 RepID=A0A5N4ADJ5_PHOPY|nr:hypothetical protein PPYR_12242 [Photinus pyralis]